MKPSAAQAFTFKDWQLNVASGELCLHYQDAQFGPFTERLIFPQVTQQRVDALGQQLQKAIDCLHWMAGVSYYKTSLARRINFTGVRPDLAQARWLEQTWQAGLAELAHTNQLGWLGDIRFNGEFAEPLARSLELAPRSLVAIGGGKDSLVSIEHLKTVGESFQLFVVGQSAFIEEVAATTGQPLYRVERYLDPRLGEANDQGAYNGHVPVTAINGCVAVVAALLGDFDAVVFSNERSADEGNLRAENGQWVNHQYSKSFAYEISWQNIVQTSLASDLRCFSLLRPFSELAIVKQFARYPRYFPVFSSCNRNFHLAGSQNQGHHWCGSCPKCAFVFLALAPFISQQELLGIFQRNLLEDEALNELYAALLDLAGIKPFECVGEARECRVAMHLLASHPDWQAHPRVRDWLTQIGNVPEHWQQALMQASERHQIPARRGFREVLKHAVD